MKPDYPTIIIYTIVLLFIIYFFYSSTENFDPLYPLGLGCDDVYKTDMKSGFVSSHQVQQLPFPHSNSTMNDSTSSGPASNIPEICKPYVHNSNSSNSSNSNNSANSPTSPNSPNAGCPCYGQLKCAAHHIGPRPIDKLNNLQNKLEGTKILQEILEEEINELQKNPPDNSPTLPDPNNCSTGKCYCVRQVVPTNPPAESQPLNMPPTNQQQIIQELLEENKQIKATACPCPPEYQ